jgi:uncharacterized protein (TIGR00369 family)
MSMEPHYRKLENMMHSAPIVQLTGARVEISKGRADMTIPVKQDFFHAAGALHGAVYFLALDNAAFFAVNSLVDDVFVLTINFNITLIRPVTSGTITAVGKVASSTATHFFADSVLLDSENREIARGGGIFVKSRIKLTPEIGYKL